MNILALNAGSSTWKYSVISAEEAILAQGTVEVASDHGAALTQVLAHLASGPPLDAVGHRVVHGGSRYTASVLVTPEVEKDISALAELAPLHNPANHAGIRLARKALPTIPHVAVFDTAFHATLPPSAYLYGIPYEWYHNWGLRRYGFHGLSHAYCAVRAVEMLGERPHRRLVICHLGNGCSAAAVRDGICIDNSMGYTPLEGLVMGTRSGSVDPGLLLHVLRRQGVSPEQLDQVLNKESGLLGLSGHSSDMRQILASTREGHARSALALDVYCHRIRQTIGALTATLGGLDALVFTAGVGENAALVRQRVCSDGWGLGMRLDPTANETCQPDSDIATADSQVRILVIHTREDLTLVRETKRVLTA